ncbi:hypothetical protein DPMN_069238 [Dreissena polymorpha]|uniref:Uncharacterized protein n=1 Tax=Dreissena polymorpha TaxID=45954 RepID=A0A9D4BUS4_DREPO|nr:hypothetical protein DPMN_069238 [Dreissena polymorpha]
MRRCKTKRSRKTFENLTHHDANDFDDDDFDDDKFVEDDDDDDLFNSTVGVAIQHETV